MDRKWVSLDIVDIKISYVKNLQFSINILSVLQNLPLFSHNFRSIYYMHLLVMTWDARDHTYGFIPTYLSIYKPPVS